VELSVWATVGGLAGGAEDAALAHAIVRLADTLDLRTVAEGIETTQQLTELRRLGCHSGQGYLFARPLPVDAMAEVLATGPPFAAIQDPGPSAPTASSSSSETTP
jgi:EAL domain-containing protein (putative c-di-GMP-specific phosphodiesterase class I)